VDLNLIGRRIGAALKKPPRIIYQRIIDELKLFIGEYTTPIKIRNFTTGKFVNLLQEKNINSLWQNLSAKNYFAETDQQVLADLKFLFKDDERKIYSLAEKALNNDLSLLGTGWINIGEKIEWHKDYKSGINWEPKYITKINYCNPNDFSDVKIPWEISRMQWLIPVGQAYLLTHDEKYAIKVKEILISWIRENPYAASVNWTCTMEVALRIFTWSWFFHVFKNSQCWKDEAFRGLFLKSLWLHGEFTEKHIERSDINGNHFTADAASMVVAGLFFDEGAAAKRWVENGWSFLEEEFPKQVFSDGVDYEASVPYHRLVLELFFFPALYKIKRGLTVSAGYLDLLKKMALFTEAYTRPDGTVPVWGDADDARALPFRHDAINDHRYLLAMVGIATGDKSLMSFFSGPVTELVWVYGTKAKFLSAGFLPAEGGSQAFTKGGFYIIRDSKNHIFIDCGPVGLAGRGGHGHNDILSFEAYLNNELLIVDSGSYLYTADYQERNNFRSTAYHNTPQIDNQEVNRFISWDYLWNLKNDAEPKVYHWTPGNEYSTFKGSHSGYHKLTPALSPVREITLNHFKSELTITDTFTGEGQYQIKIPFHFHPNVKLIEKRKGNAWECISGTKSFLIKKMDNDDWAATKTDCRISFSYGTCQQSSSLIFTINGDKHTRLCIQIQPQ